MVVELCSKNPMLLHFLLGVCVYLFFFPNSLNHLLYPFFSSKILNTCSPKEIKNLLIEMDKWLLLIGSSLKIFWIKNIYPSYMKKVRNC